jgi:hypothetical protein
MKDAGVTTVILFADGAMNTAMMNQADRLQWFPEWFYTATGYNDHPLGAVVTPDDQAEHAFGLSILGPYIDTPPDVAAISGVTGAYNWYWGPAAGSTSQVLGPGIDWLLAGIHNAGPNLTAKNFQRGLFAAPPVGPTPNNPNVGLSGYGRTTGLSYDAYSRGPASFGPFFMDPYTEVHVIGFPASVTAKQANWYLKDAKNAARYASGQWPKSLPWFDKSAAITEVTEAPAFVAAPPCAAGKCPATGATAPKPGDTSDTFSVEPTTGAVVSATS